MKRFLVFLFLLCASPAMAASICSGPTATGNGSGSDWNNLFAFNTGTLVRGNTYYLADGSYASRSFNTAASGTTLITIKKAIASDHATDTGWSSTYGDGQAVFRAPLLFASNYWVLDGQYRTGIRSGHGIKVDNYTVKASMDGNIQIGNTNPATASYVTIRYVEIAGTGRIDGSYWEDGILSADEIYSTNLTVSYCWIHDQAGVNLAFRALSNVVVEYSVIERDYSTPASHSEGVVLKHTDNVTFRYNLLSDIEGTAYIATPSGARNAISNTYIYGNVFEMPAVPQRGGSGMGPIAVWDCDSTGDFFVYNNTFVNIRDALIASNPRNPNSSANITFGTGYTATFTRVYIRNNLWVNCDAIVNPAADPYTTIGTYAWSHNAYYGTSTWDGSGYNSQTLSSNPIPNWTSSVYTLSGTTSAGYTLSSPYNLDPAAITRGSDGTWDRGAYEYGGGGGGDTTPPTVSSATINAAGTSITLAMSETVSIGSGGNGGFTVSPSGGAATLTYASGSGSSSLVYTISRAIQYGETVTRSYTQPGNGVEDAAGNDLANFSGAAVTNSSTTITLSALSPSGYIACTSNPRNVTLEATSEVATRIRYSNLNIGYLSMTSLMDSAPATAHSATVTNLACGAAYTFYLRDPVGPSPTLISFQIDPETSGAPRTLKHARGRGLSLK